ncbi:MAG: radical SAM protein [Candidatus Omnitrophica bacterium]|nr:radical SAM protein [Candidatus Omnitrophota bacterium]
MESILLINLPWQEKKRRGVRAGSRWPHLKTAAEGNYMPFPFYLAYAAAWLKQHGFKAHLVDAPAEGLNYAETIERIRAVSPVLLLAETATVTRTHDLKFLARVAGIVPRIAICGPDAQIADESFLRRHPEIAFVLYGEYEATVLDLVRALRDQAPFAEIPGLIFRQGAAVIKNPPRPLLQDLDCLPWPLRTHLPASRYCDAPCGIAEPCAIMWASRGCPFRCSFCLWPQVMYGGNSYRARGIVDVVDEMEYLINRRQYRSIYFDDDTWNVGRERLLAFCAELRRRKFFPPWAIMASAALMDKELLDNLRAAGLFAVKYGVESSSPALLRQINKGLDVHKVAEIVGYTKQLGIRVHLTFTFGLPGETDQTAADTIAFARQLDPFSVQFSLATPFPGTRFYERMQREGKIVSRNPAHYDGNYGSVIRTDSLSARRVRFWKERAYRQWARHCRQRELPGGGASFDYYWGRTAARIKAGVRRIGFLYGMLRFTRSMFSRAAAAALRLRRRKPLWPRTVAATRPIGVLAKGAVSITFENGMARLFWQQRQISRGVGFTTSFFYENQWFDSSSARWIVDELTGETAVLSVVWEAIAVEQRWQVRLQENDAIQWRSCFVMAGDAPITEYKAGLMLPPVYDAWHDGTGVGMLPDVRGWEEIGLYNAVSSEILMMSVQSPKKEFFPQLTLELAAAADYPVYAQVQNTSREIGARLTQMRVQAGRCLAAGEHFLELRISLKENVPMQAPPVRYARPAPFQYVRERIVALGSRNVARKIVRNAQLRRLFDYYGEVLGVLDGSYAYRGPAFLQIDLTNACNNDCIGCWCNSHLLKEKKRNDVYRRQMLPTTLVLDTLHAVAKIGTREIYFAGGGEPFMHPDIMAIVTAVKKLGMRCYINTNFTLVNEDHCRQLIEARVDHLVVSVWAATPQTYQATHPNKSAQTFYTVQRVLRYLNEHKRQGPQVNVYNVISNVNYRELEAMVDFAVATKSDSLEFTVIDTIPGATDVLLLSDMQRQEILEQCRVISRRLRTDLHGKIRIQQFDQFVRRVDTEHARCAEYDKKMLKDIPCYNGWAFARIMADGDVNFCLKAHRIPSGNLYAQTFAQIWNGRNQREFRMHAVRPRKEHPFFSFIGNDENAAVGCYKSCDDIARVITLYKKVQSLSRAERWTLRGLLALWKIKRTIDAVCRGKRVGAGRGGDDLRASLQHNKIEVRFQQRSIRIFYDGKELTRSVGMAAAFRLYDLWYDSTQAEWAVIEHLPQRVRLRVTWTSLPLVQTWVFTPADSDSLDIVLITTIEEQMVIQEEKVSLLLADAYTEWFAAEQCGIMPENTNWQDVFSAQECVEAIGFRSVNGNGRLPSIALRFNGAPDGKFFPQIQNSGRMLQARVLSAWAIPAAPEQPLVPGTVDSFRGRITIRPAHG